MFSTIINLSDELQIPSPFPGRSTSLVRGAGSGPMKHRMIGSLEVPDRYCKRRGSYCNQEEDEDKTDLEGKSNTNTNTIKPSIDSN